MVSRGPTASSSSYDGATAAQRQLRGAMARALERWPRLGVSFEAYLRFVERVVPWAGGDDAPDLETLALEDIVLATACLHGDPWALRYFERTVLTAIDSAITRIDDRPEFVDEVRQQLRQRLLAEPSAKIAEYRGQGPLARWVTVAAVRTALNLRAQEQRAQARMSAEAQGSPLADPLDLEAETFKAEYRPALAAAVRQACRGLDPRDR
ncbi:MAG: hypothetical protein AAGF11_47425, partial [Myxococcota bacterium]